MSFSLRRSSDDDRSRHREGYNTGRTTYKRILNAGSLVTSGIVLGGFALVKDKVPYDQVVKVADHMVKENGLDKKGFKYHFIDKEIDENLINITAKGFRESPVLKPLNYVLKRIKNENIKKPIERGLDTQFKFMANYMLYIVKSGFNAFYMPEGNFAVTGKKRASLMLHEVGHGINANKSRLAKGLQTGARYLPKLAVPLLLFNSLTHSAKYEQGDSRSTGTKVRDFFEANAAKLTILSFAPMIAEEALASARGLSAAKKVLGKGNTGTFKKFYALGLASYVSAGVLSSFAVKKASEERDRVVYDL